MAMEPLSPIFMTAPWPNCFSIWLSAMSRAFSRPARDSALVPMSMTLSVALPPVLPFLPISGSPFCVLFVGSLSGPA